MNKSQRFSDIFEDLPFSDKLEKRIANLTSLLSEAVSSGSDRGTFVRIYDWKDSTDTMLEILKKTYAERVKAFCVDPPSITFSTKNGQRIDCDYLCVEHKRLYFIPSDRASLRRFIYFEIYYDEYIVSCLMDALSFHKNVPMDALEMDIAEWAHAKLQMKLWNEVFLPDIEEIDLSDTGPLYQPAIQRLETYSDLWDANIPSVLPPIEPIWVLLTYLHLLQIMPFLSPKQVPCYVIHFVCAQNTDTFVRNLCAFLSVYWQEDPVMNRPVSVSQTYLKKETGKDITGAVQPYILRPNRTNSKALQEIERDVLDYDRLQVRSWEQHPFLNTVPIIVADEKHDSQVFLDISVDGNMEFPDAADVRNGFLRFWSQLYRHFFPSGRVDRKKLNKSYETMDSQVSTQLSEQNRVYLQPQLYSLCVWFCLMYNQKSIIRKKIKLTDDKLLWLHDLENSWKKKDVSLESAVSTLLDIITAEWRQHPGTLPRSKEAWDQNDLDFIKVDISGEACLIRKPEHFKKLIKEACPDFSADDVICYLADKEYLKTNGNEHTCVYKIEKKSVRTFALYCNRLPMDS